MFFIGVLWPMMRFGCGGLWFLPGLQAAIDFYHQHQPQPAREVSTYNIARPVRAQVDARDAYDQDERGEHRKSRAPQPPAPEQDVREEKQKAEKLYEEDHVARGEALVIKQNL